MPEEGKEHIPVMRPVESLRAEARSNREEQQLSEIKKKGLAVVASVSGIGATVVLISGLRAETEAKSEETYDPPVNSSHTERLLIQKLERQERVVSIGAFGEVFGDISGQDWQDAKDKVLKFKIGPRYGSAVTDGRVDAVKEYNEHFEAAALKFGVPKEILAGIALLESGGHPDVTSTYGARGLMQLMPEAARRSDLKVELPEDFPDKKPEDLIDERTDPVKSIYAAAKYLSTMKQEEFGENLGIAVLGYYIGDGYTFSLLQEYFRDTKEIELERVDPNDEGHKSVIKTYSDAIKDTDLSVHTLLTNPAVQQEIPRLDLDEDTNDYPYIAVTCAQIMSEN
jgi:hypothetical protein